MGHLFISEEVNESLMELKNVSNLREVGNRSTVTLESEAPNRAVKASAAVTMAATDSASKPRGGSITTKMAEAMPQTPIITLLPHLVKCWTKAVNN